MSRKNEHIHFKGQENFLSRMNDYVEKAHSYREVFTPFLTPIQQDTLVRYVGKEIYVRFDGGHENSESKRAFLYAMEMDVRFPIICLYAKFHLKYHEIDHRDVLGALMNLGIQRSQFGDILIEDGTIYIFVCEEIASFVQMEFTKVKHCRLLFTPYAERVSIQVTMRYATTQISSFRLDVLVSAMCKQSREKAKKIIEAGNVKVNHLPLEDCSYICNNESVISIRGYGRFQVIDLKRRTKSNRYCVEIGTYE